MIKFLFFDIDGTITDGKITFTENLHVSKTYNVKDISVLWKLQEHNIQVIAITGSNYKCDNRALNFIKKSPNRIQKIPFLIQNCWNKKEKMLDVLSSFKKSKNAYIGDYLNDLECLKITDLPACPSDAYKKIIKTVKNRKGFVCSKKCGEGAILEFADYLINNNF